MVIRRREEAYIVPRDSYVFYAEASQAHEPATLIPITKGSQQVICIGDQNQLPPIV